MSIINVINLYWNLKWVYITNFTLSAMAIENYRISFSDGPCLNMPDLLPFFNCFQNTPNSFLSLLKKFTIELNLGANLI